MVLIRIELTFSWEMMRLLNMAEVLGMLRPQKRRARRCADDEVDLYNSIVVQDVEMIVMRSGVRCQHFDPGSCSVVYQSIAVFVRKFIVFPCFMPLSRLFC